jgi:hypothetical protein
VTAVERRKPGRPRTDSVRLGFHVSGEAGRWLASRMGRMPRDGDVRSQSTQAAAEIGLWRTVLDAELARIRLTLPQAIAIADVLNSPDTDPAIGLSMGVVFARCHEAFRLARSGPGGEIGSYGNQHGFDETELLDYLGSLGPAADHALADAISRWWAEIVPQEGLTRIPEHDDLIPPFDASSIDGFAAVGLRVAG